MNYGEPISWSYSYSTKKGDTTWAHRMDHYYKIGDTDVHWTQLAFSATMVFVLTCCVCAMLKKGLSIDEKNFKNQAISRAERRKQRIAGSMEIDSSTGPRPQKSAASVAWKKLHGHVFAAPGYPAIFSCFLGAGAQIFLMFYLTLNSFFFFFTIESLRPPIFYVVMCVLALMGFVNGLVTMRSLKFFGLTDWFFSATVASVALPTFIYCTLGLEIIFYSMAGGYRRSSLMTSIGLTLIWVLVNMGTALLGSY